MLLEDNPIMKKINEFKREQLRLKFDMLRKCDHNNFLSIWGFLSTLPEKYYLDDAFKSTFSYLSKIMNEDRAFLVKYLNEYQEKISLAVKSANEVNALEIHDIKIAVEDDELMLFVEEKIHPTYLKLMESSFSNLILLFAAYSRYRRGKQLDGLDLYNRVDEVRRIPLISFFAEYYNNILRNAIAHGDVRYRLQEVIYRDKEKEVVAYLKDVIKIYDDFVDLVNGIILGYEIFILLNKTFLITNNVVIPKQIMINELKFETEGPGWRVRSCLESETIKGNSQLNIFTQNTFLDTFKLRFYTFRTALIAESFAPHYDRYFFRLDSMYSLSGWAGFDGKKLRDLRVKKSQDPTEYSQALEGGMIFFIPKIKLPRIIFKISNFLTIAKIHFKIEIDEVFKKILPFSLTMKDYEAHTNRFYRVIRASIVLKSNNLVPIDTLIRQYCSSIMRKVVRAIKKREKIFCIHKYLPIGLISVSIYSEDFRKRQMVSHGPIPEQICRIEFKRIKKIKQIDYFGGDHEYIKKYIVFWNKKPARRNSNHLNTLQLQG